MQYKQVKPQVHLHVTIDSNKAQPCTIKVSARTKEVGEGRGCDSLVVVDLVQDGAHEDSHDGSKNEACTIVGAVTPVADPELPEDHPELGEVVLGVLVLECQGLGSLLGDAQLLNQLLVLPEQEEEGQS